VPDQLEDADVHGAHDGIVPQALYSRPMPGGGYVRVELLVSEPAAVATERLRGRVIMERRTPMPATPEEEHLIVEEVEGDDVDIVVAELIRIARDNAAIARRVLRRRTPRTRAD
jgi:hypothetical protein